MSREDIYLSGFEKSCHKCQKMFFMHHPTLYVYKLIKGRRKFWYCSYTCFRKDQIRIVDRRKRNGGNNI